MIAPITIMIIIITGLTSAYAFSNPEFRSNALFVPAMIKNRGEYHRWVSAGFVHSDWMHLIFNMYALYIFGPYVEQLFSIIFGDSTIGGVAYILFYLVSIPAASYVDYTRHQDNYGYRALGASGAVAAMMWPLIFYIPWEPIFWGFIPPIVLGVGYILYSHYADKKGGSNIGHSAHLWGAIFGVLAYTAICAAFAPEVLADFFFKLTNPQF